MSSSVICRAAFASQVVAFALSLLICTGITSAQPVPTGSRLLLLPGTTCGFIAPCTRIGEIGLHISALTSFRTDRDRSFVDAQGQLRGAITFLDLAEIGTQFAGHIGRDRAGYFFAQSSPASLYARLRLLPLPFFRVLAGSNTRLVIQAQHEFVSEQLGLHEPPGVARTTLLAIGGKSYGPIDLDGSIGFVLAPNAQNRPQQATFTLGLASSYWFKRPEANRPSDQLRLQLEALYQFAQDARFSTQGTILAGLLGMTHSGFGGSIAVGPEFIEEYVGVRVLGGLQFSWGPHVRNPWAERKAAEPKETPTWIWSLLGAIDPILREDGCVWSDPTPQRPSYRMFCIGQPDPQQPGMIQLDSGRCLPVGTHLWEHGGVMRLNDGTQVAKIPLTSRFRSAVLDYVDGLLRHDPDPALCDGRLDPIPRGLDEGLASVVAHDDMGGSAAVMGMQLYRQITCNPEAQSSAQILSLLGKVGSRGPLRARPNLSDDRFGTPREKLRGGGGTGGEEEHRLPPRNLPGSHRFSIRQNEERGGHILAKHVGKSEAQLSKRLEAEPSLKTASSFRDESTAEQAIASAIDNNQSTIDRWLKKPRREKLVIEYESESSMGTSLKRGTSVARPSNVATIVLQPDSDGGFYVLTAYLE